MISLCNFSSIIIFLNTKLNVYLLTPQKIIYVSINSQWYYPSLCVKSSHYLIEWEKLFFIPREKSWETHINVGARPKSVAGAPFFGLSQQSDGAVGAVEILRQVYGIALCPENRKYRIKFTIDQQRRCVVAYLRNIVLDEFAVSCDRRQVDQRSIVEI